MKAVGGLALRVRWPRLWDVVLPVVIVAGQMLAWPGWPLLHGTAVPPVQVAATVGLYLLIAAALCWRRIAPGPVFGLVIALLVVLELVAPLEQLFVMGAADQVALFSVAALRRARPALIAAGVGIGAQTVVSLLTYHGLNRSTANFMVFGLGIYALTLVLGRARRHWRRARAEARELLAAAERAQAVAADAERRRLALDLHDMAGHHLTAVVVHTGAAIRRPELAGDALRLAVRAGHDTLDALSLSAREESLAELDALVDGFARAGMTVTVRVDGERRDLPPDTAAAGYRIAQEALTNALRYAAGAPVEVTVAYTPTGVTLTVRNGPAAHAPPERLGGGAGIDGMRERAGAIGGEVTAGPEPGGGWTVRAHLPAPAVAETPPGPPWLREPVAFDLVAAAATLMLPIGTLITLGGVNPPVQVTTGRLAGVVLVVILLAHALTLLWRRRAPYLCLLVAAVVSAAWCGLIAAGLFTAASLSLLVMAWPVEAIAVYSVAAYARRSWPTLAALLASIAWDATIGGYAGYLDVHRFDAGAVWFSAIVSTAVLTPNWIGGMVARRQRARRAHREGSALRAAVLATAAAAREARESLAAELRRTVAGHTRATVAAAERGLAAAIHPPPSPGVHPLPVALDGHVVSGGVDGRGVPHGSGGLDGVGCAEVLAEVGGHARTALAAMRELIATLRADRDPPVPGQRAAGEDGTAEAGPREVPQAVVGA